VSTKLPNFTVSYFRHTEERMDPAQYLNSSYYERWLTVAATMAVEAGLSSPEELDTRAQGLFPLSRPARSVQVDDLGTGSPSVTVCAFGNGIRSAIPGVRNTCWAMLAS
jgi:nitrile hydratase subunit beta